MHVIFWFVNVSHQDVSDKQSHRGNLSAAMKRLLCVTNLVARTISSAWVSACLHKFVDILRSHKNYHLYKLFTPFELVSFPALLVFDAVLTTRIWYHMINSNSLGHIIKLKSAKHVNSELRAEKRIKSFVSGERQGTWQQQPRVWFHWHWYLHIAMKNPISKFQRKENGTFLSCEIPNLAWSMLNQKN